MIDDTAEQATSPTLRVVRGDPTPEELAAVVAVLAARAAAAPPPPAPTPGQWRSRGRNIRPALRPGPDAWRSSGLPR